MASVGLTDLQTALAQQLSGTAVRQPVKPVMHLLLLLPHFAWQTARHSKLIDDAKKLCCRSPCHTSTASPYHAMLFSSNIQGRRHWPARAAVGSPEEAASALPSPASAADPSGAASSSAAAASTEAAAADTGDSAPHAPLHHIQNWPLMYAVTYDCWSWMHEQHDAEDLHSSQQIWCC